MTEHLLSARHYPSAGKMTVSKTEKASAFMVRVDRYKQNTSNCTVCAKAIGTVEKNKPGKEDREI